MTLNLQEIPGLSQPTILQTYFRLLPKELLQLMAYFYVYPVTVKIISIYRYNKKTSVTMTITRQTGEQIIDEIITSININTFFSFIESFEGYTSEDDVVFFKDGNVLKIGIRLKAGAIRVYYDGYQFDTLMSKLKLIQEKIDVCYEQNMRTVDIFAKITNYRI